jgi:hypothetical protein
MPGLANSLELMQRQSDPIAQDPTGTPLPLAQDWEPVVPEKPKNGEASAIIVPYRPFVLQL